MAAKIPEVTSVKVTGHYRLHVGFSDGAEGDVDVSDLRDAGGVFEPLRDPAYFGKAFVDGSAGTVAWPNGADLAPEVLHDELAGRGSDDPGSDNSTAVKEDSFSAFAQQEFESLVAMLREITELPSIEARDLVQLALTEASARWDEPAVSTNPREWVLGWAIWLCRRTQSDRPAHRDLPSEVSAGHAPIKSVLPISGGSASAGVRVTGALAVAVSETSMTVEAQPGVVQAEYPGQAALYSAHFRSLVRLATLLVQDVASAENIVNDSFVSLRGARDRRRSNQEVLSYLRASVVNRSRSVLRHRAVIDHNAPKPPPDMPSAEHGAMALIERSSVVAALRSLPDRQREVVVLRFYADLSDAQIAEAMGISRGAVKVHTARAMSALRRVLKREDAPSTN
jgi:RNA polymerase sigma-70 factor (sigma-E family)